ncbi:hypothetical protein SEA_HANK144_44 [Streptomyces phage Hank144]|uniref:Uncharacterized protein n=1 Tax=Streptomyces phage Hank144 TaxID=2301573 RepID=A0A385DR62_9CAUD|nr:hypothetical protein KGG76_gp44 [Streptomyces phage Hank144]AXQ61099.1 hypothetical protein SEA_HANK144_44 [Streptomyces phage Hank144]
MAAELKHGRLAYVVPPGTHEVVLAQFTQHDPDSPGYFAYFGTEFTHWPEEVEIVELAVTRSV